MGGVGGAVGGGGARGGGVWGGGRGRKAEEAGGGASGLREVALALCVEWHGEVWPGGELPAGLVGRAGRQQGQGTMATVSAAGVGTGAGAGVGREGVVEAEAGDVELRVAEQVRGEVVGMESWCRCCGPGCAPTRGARAFRGSGTPSWGCGGAGGATRGTAAGNARRRTGGWGTSGSVGRGGGGVIGYESSAAPRGRYEEPRYVRSYACEACVLQVGIGSVRCGKLMGYGRDWTPLWR